MANERLLDFGFHHDDYFQRRELDELPNDMLSDMRLILIDKSKDPVVLGSAKDKFVKYPADIDILEFYEGCCDIDKVVSDFILKLQNVVSEINNHPNHYYSEVKAARRVPSRTRWRERHVITIL